MMRMIAAVRPIRPDFTFLTGWEAVLAPMLMVGCDGGTNASSNAVPEVTRRIYELCRAREITKRPCSGNTASSRSSTPCSTPSSFPTASAPPPSCAASSFGGGRQPQTAVQKTDRTELAKVLQCILADFELVDRPAAGCAPRISQPATDKMEQVVFEVMHELEKRGIF